MNAPVTEFVMDTVPFFPFIIIVYVRPSPSASLAVKVSLNVVSSLTEAVSPEETGALFEGVLTVIVTFSGRLELEPSLTE